MAAMGISGFGPQKKKKDKINVKQFEKNKRQTEVSPTSVCIWFSTDIITITQLGAHYNQASATSEAPEPQAAGPSGHRSTVSPEPGPTPAVVSQPHNDTHEEPEFDPDADENNSKQEFPISHELTMKDHTKVVSALALDTSGARFVSGSHDYDCKLWDFGGMGASPKPFKTWEPWPEGNYHVCSKITILSIF